MLLFCIRLGRVTSSMTPTVLFKCPWLYRQKQLKGFVLRRNRKETKKKGTRRGSYGRSEFSVYDPQLVVGHLEGVLVDDSTQDLVEALLGIRQHLLVEQSPELVDDVQSQQTYKPGLENVKQQYQLNMYVFLRVKG